MPSNYTPTDEYKLIRALLENPTWLQAEDLREDDWHKPVSYVVKEMIHLRSVQNEYPSPDELPMAMKTAINAGRIPASQAQGVEQMADRVKNLPAVSLVVKDALIEYIRDNRRRALVADLKGSKSMADVDEVTRKLLKLQLLGKPSTDIEDLWDQRHAVAACQPPPPTALRMSIKGIDEINGGVVELDDALGGGLYEGQLVVCLAGTNVGKTMFGLHCTRMAEYAGLNVLQLCTEETTDEIRNRWVCAITETVRKEAHLKVNHVSSRMRKHYDELEKRHKRKDFVKFIRPEGKSVSELRTKVLDYKAQGWMPNLIVVDNLTKLTSLRASRTDADWIRLAYVAGDLADLASDLGILIIATAQSTKEAWTAERTELQHVGRSKFILDEASIVLTLSATREEKKENALRINLEKSRMSAALGEMRIHHQFPCYRFYDPGKTLSMAQGVGAQATATQAAPTAAAPPPSMPSGKIAHRRKPKKT